jgi:hypothetical protein
MMSAPPPDGVAGMVSDATKQSSIAGATVQLMDSDGDELTEVTTDAASAFTLANLSPAMDTLVVTAPGYADSDPLQVSVPVDTRLAVMLSPLPQPADSPTDDIEPGLSPR